MTFNSKIRSTIVALISFGLLPSVLLAAERITSLHATNILTAEKTIQPYQQAAIGAFAHLDKPISSGEMMSFSEVSLLENMAPLMSYLRLAAHLPEAVKANDPVARELLSSAQKAVDSGGAENPELLSVFLDVGAQPFLSKELLTPLRTIYEAKVWEPRRQAIKKLLEGGVRQWESRQIQDNLGRIYGPVAQEAVRNFASKEFAPLTGKRGKSMSSPKVLAKLAPTAALLMTQRKYLPEAETELHAFINASLLEGTQDDFYSTRGNTARPELKAIADLLKYLDSRNALGFRTLSGLSLKALEAVNKWVQEVDADLSREALIFGFNPPLKSP